MSKIDDGGQAYPTAGYDGPDYKCDPVEGMSMRDYFAAQAMAGMWSNPGTSCAKREHTKRLAETISWTAYVMADAMLEGRYKETGASDIAPPTKPPIIT